MKILAVFFQKIIIIFFISQNSVCADLSLLNPLNSQNWLYSPTQWLPSFRIGPLAPLNVFRSGGDTQITTTTEVVIIKNDVIEIEEIIFKVSPRIQSFFNPGDPQAKENFIMSPLSASILFGNALLGMYGWHHNCVAKIMGLKPILKGGALIFEQGKQPLYGDKVYHEAYHSRLKALTNRGLSNEDKNKIKLNTALFYKSESEIVPDVQNKMKYFYQTDIIPIDGNQEVNSTDTIQQWSAKNLQVKQAMRPTVLVNPEFESVLLNTFLFNATWKTPMTKIRKKKYFYVKPYERVKVNYLQGIINATYIDTDIFTIVGVPLNQNNTHLYILLPQGNDFTNYNIRQFSEGLTDYKQFLYCLENYEQIRNVKLTLPDIFTQFVELNFLKPVLNYINDENQIYRKPMSNKIELHYTAKSLTLNGMIQYMYFSINNKTIEVLPKPAVPNKKISSQPYTTLSPSKFTLPNGRQNLETLTPPNITLNYSNKTLDLARPIQPNGNFNSTTIAQSNVSLKLEKIINDTSSSTTSSLTNKTEDLGKPIKSKKQSKFGSFFKLFNFFTPENDTNLKNTLTSAVDSLTTNTWIPSQPTETPFNMKTIDRFAQSESNYTSVSEMSAQPISTFSSSSNINSTGAEIKPLLSQYPETNFPEYPIKNRTEQFQSGKLYVHPENNIQPNAHIDSSKSFIPNITDGTSTSKTTHPSQLLKQSLSPQDPVKYTPESADKYPANRLNSESWQKESALKNLEENTQSFGYSENPYVEQHHQFTHSDGVSPYDKVDSDSQETRDFERYSTQNIPSDGGRKRVKRKSGTEESQNYVDFEVTRPFVFIVMDRNTNLVLIWGSISNPEKLQ